jgi:surface antigen
MTAPARLLVLVLTACIAAFAGGVALGRYAVPSGKPKGTPVTIADGVTVYFSGSATQQLQRRRRDAQALATARVRSAIPALEAWYADHNGYTGATLAGLRTYDRAIQRVRVVFATRADYCLESRVGGKVASKHGPGGDLVQTACGR